MSEAWAHRVLRDAHRPGNQRAAGSPQRHLDEEAVADVAHLHGFRVRLPDVLLHLQDGPGVQGELSFLLQRHSGGGNLSGPFLLGVLFPLQSHSPRPLTTAGFHQPWPTGVHAGPLAEPQAEA